MACCVVRADTRAVRYQRAGVAIDNDICSAIRVDICIDIDA